MGLFSGRDKADHPLADPKEAKRLLGALPAGDPHQALSEINDWIDSVCRAEDFRLDDRFELLMLLDDNGQIHARKRMIGVYCDVIQTHVGHGDYFATISLKLHSHLYGLVAK